MPKVAMAQPGSSARTCRNAFSPALNQNECSMATPRCSSPCTFGSHELAKDTLPRWPPCCVSWDRERRRRGRTLHGGRGRQTMNPHGNPLCVRRGAWAVPIADGRRDSARQPAGRRVLVLGRDGGWTRRTRRRRASSRVGFRRRAAAPLRRRCARLAVRPGDSMPYRFIRPGTPCASGPCSMKSRDRLAGPLQLRPDAAVGRRQGAVPAARASSGGSRRRTGRCAPGRRRSRWRRATRSSGSHSTSGPKRAWPARSSVRCTPRPPGSGTG